MAKRLNIDGDLELEQEVDSLTVQIIEAIISELGVDVADDALEVAARRLAVIAISNREKEEEADGYQEEELEFYPDMDEFPDDEEE